MRNNILLTLAGMLAALICGVSDIGAVSRVPARINVLEFYGGASTAQGSYDGFRGEDWVRSFEINTTNPSVDADNIYGSSFNLGFSYGQLRNNHIFYAVGFRYTKIELDSVVIVPLNNADVFWTPSDGYKENLYDITFDLNYYPYNIVKQNWSPYVGVGFKGGLMVFSQSGRDANSGLAFASETEVKFSSSINLGLDLKLWNDKAHRTQVVLSSINSFDFWGSGNRPRYLNLGIGLKYYFRP